MMPIIVKDPWSVQQIQESPIINLQTSEWLISGMQVFYRNPEAPSRLHSPIHFQEKAVAIEDREERLFLVYSVPSLWTDNLSVMPRM